MTNMLRLLKKFASTIFFFLLITSNSASGSEIKLLLDSLETKLDWINYRTSLEYWDLYTTGQSDSLSYYERLEHYILSNPEDLKQLQAADTLSDNVDRRRRDILYSLFTHGRHELQPDISHLRDSLSNLDINFRSIFDGDTVTADFLYNRYRSNSNRAERERAYRAWCEIGGIMSNGLGRLIRMRNKAAQTVGYNSYFALMFKEKGIDLDAYKALIGELDSLSRAPFEQIYSARSQKIGVSQIEPWDWGYAFADVRSQVDRLFPIDSQLLYIERSLEGIGINLEAMPIYFDLDSRPNKSQLAYAFTIRAGKDMRVLANLSDGIGSARRLFHEIGHALHSAYITQEQPLFQTNLDGAWAEGIAQFFAGMMDNNLWLEKYAHLSYPLATQYLKEKKESDLIYLRSQLARLEFEMLAYENPNRDLNDLYWDLQAKYLKSPKHDDLMPWATIIHYTTHPVYLDNYLYADIISAQTHHYLKEQYQGVVDKPSSRSFLIQNYLRFGSRYDWRELLERGTEEQLNPEYLISNLGLSSE